VVAAGKNNANRESGELSQVDEHTSWSMVEGVKRGLSCSRGLGLFLLKVAGAGVGIWRDVGILLFVNISYVKH
jgi:hypothetical protein